VRVIVVDDHQIARAGVRAALTADRRVSAFLEASTGAEALRLMRSDPPDLAVVDLRLPDMSGEQLVAEMVRLQPRLPVIVLTTYLSERTIRGVLDAGAVAYVTKAAGIDALIDAMDRVLDGEAAHAAEGPQIVEQLRSVIGDRMGAPSLTGRQREILGFIADGYTYDEISEEIGISKGTVAFHVGRLKIKLDARSTSDLIAKAVRLGYVARSA